MTVVIGTQFEEVIVILSDTMISDRDRPRDNALPGRLKAIIVNSHLSIAYSGHSDPALHAIRITPKKYTEGGLKAVLSFLREFTDTTDHCVEFLVASHNPSAELRRIWEGRVSDPLPQACIGNCAILREILKRHPDNGGPREFNQAFLAAFTDRTVFRGTGVGGFPITLEARPEGHRYKGHTFNENWKPIIPRWGETMYEDEADLQTGEWSFRHDIMDSQQPRLAVLAAEVLQGKVGFVYAPLLENDPQRVTLLSADKKWTKNQREMHDVMRTALNDKIARLKANQEG